MPTGQPDPHFLPQEQGAGDGGGTPSSPATPEPSLPGGATQQEYAASADVVRGHAERLIRKAMEAGEFDDLPGTGEPIPGAGTVDDELWWVRSWLQRNKDREWPESG